MFRREVLVPVEMRGRSVEYVDRNVTIKNAPTDESVRLLRELEVAAEQKIVNATRVSNTALECVVHHFVKHEDMSTTLRAIFKLNGKMAKAEYACTDMAPKLCDLWEGLRNEIAKVVASELLVKGFDPSVAIAVTRNQNQNSGG